tara:strand:- start:58 stop:831 length:774 start_codon:yes stop_codon:yes gene_type:complete
MVINLQNVSFKYGNVNIIREITAHFNPGELVSLVGPNGAGKTTLLKLISGTLKPSSGKIYIYDQLSHNLTNKKRAIWISMVPQNPKLPNELSIPDFVMLGRNPHLGLLQWESKEDFNIARKSMSLTEIDYLSGRKLGEISGGEKQRAMLALAITQQSPIMLLDEPTSNLDISHQRKVMKIIRRIHEEKSGFGATVLAIHDLNIAAQFSDRILLFSNGSIAADGTPKEVLTKNNIESIYGSEVTIITHPEHGTPVIIS